MGRILGIDFGLARIGLALSDPSKNLASPYKTIQAKKSLEKTAEEIAHEVKDLDLETLVIGLPLLLSGKDSETTKAVRHFATLLEKHTNVPLILWDERLTSKQVDKMLIEKKVNRKKRAKLSDTLSAALILQTYLDSL